jgi:uncharacterized integral membrane protein
MIELVLMGWFLGVIMCFASLFYYLHSTDRRKPLLTIFFISLFSWLGCLILLVILIERVVDLEKKVRELEREW